MMLDAWGGHAAAGMRALWWRRIAGERSHWLFEKVNQRVTLVMPASGTCCRLAITPDYRECSQSVL